MGKRPMGMGDCRSIWETKCRGSVTIWWRTGGARSISRRRLTLRFRQKPRGAKMIQILTRTFASLPTGLALFDTERRLQVFNPALVDLTGAGPVVPSSAPWFRAGSFHLARIAHVCPNPRISQLGAARLPRWSAPPNLAYSARNGALKMVAFIMSAGVRSRGARWPSSSKT